MTKRVTPPNEYELTILREVAGLTEQGRHDGARFCRSFESLRGAGYIDKKGDLTDTGRAAISPRGAS